MVPEQFFVIPAKAGIQEICASLDSRLRGNDVRGAFSARLTGRPDPRFSDPSPPFSMVRYSAGKTTSSGRSMCQTRKSCFWKTPAFIS